LAASNDGIDAASPRTACVIDNLRMTLLWPQSPQLVFIDVNLEIRPAVAALWKTLAAGRASGMKRIALVLLFVALCLAVNAAKPPALRFQ